MTDRRKSSLAVWLIVGAVLSPIAYLVSFGPFVWLHDHGYLPHQIMWLYMPLIYAHREYEPARQAIEWYVGLFGV